MEILDAPGKCFDSLPGNDLDDAVTDVGDGLVVHHVEAGSGPVVLVLHGQPTRSYLYRAMINRIACHGNRVVAPDLIGFGKSSKPWNTPTTATDAT